VEAERATFSELMQTQLPGNRLPKDEAMARIRGRLLALPGISESGEHTAAPIYFALV
jgi:hypothetical protein